MALFDINFQTLVKQLLPVRLRKPITIRWLQCLITPAIELYLLFTANRYNNLYLLAHNAQVTYLQAVLNDVFDPISRGIYIMDGGNTDPLYVYLNAELVPLWLGLASEIGTSTYQNPRWLYTATESTISLSCFIIRVPTTVTFDVYRLRAVVDKYRLASKSNYAVQVF